MDLAIGRSLVQRWRAGATASLAPDPASVSTAQRGVLIFEGLYPGSAVFNLRHVVRHTGHLDEDRLDRALSTLVDRHAVLRSTFVHGADEADRPVRILRDDRPVKAQWTDFRHLPPHARETAAREHAERVAREPFDIARGPLVRVHGCRLGEGERLLVFLAHHLVCDGVSMQVLLSELDAAYRGDLTGPAPEPAPAPVDPAALDYWRTQLAGLPTLDLPVDRARPVHPTYRAGSVPITLTEDLVTATERLARDAHATLFMVILAAFQLLLGEASGQDDFAVGVPEAGRAGRGQRGVVGLVADLLVLRADLRGRPTFRELVRRVRDTTLAGFAHRGVPFEELVAAVAPGRHVDGALIRACLAFHGDAGDPRLAGAPLEPVHVDRPALRYDVDLHLWRERGRLRGSWDYRSEAFDPATAARMTRRLSVLLAQVLAEPDRPVDHLELLTDDDRELLARWQCGPAPDEPDASLPDLFAAQVGRTPDAVAVRDAQRQLTFRQLDERSNRLAHYLRARAVGAGDVVGIRLSRSVDLAVAMVGIHKVGAAYVPLDPAYPADRTEYMIRDSAARLVLTDAVLSDDLDGQPSSALNGEPVPPDSPAYVLYTSGSTGRPKGVLLTHRNAALMVSWARRAFSPADRARVLASTSICFDVSVFEFFVPLCTGGTIVVVDNALSLLTETPDVTMVSAVPSAARALVEAGALPPSVRVVGLGGEAVTGTLPDDIYATGHVRAVVNLYGPTEDTTYSTHAHLAPGEMPPPIGVLLPHERGYVVDRALRRVPVGVVGELYLAGSKLSWGYINNAGLTAARYLADPFAAVPGQRIYRTGDLVRYRPDGALLYLGRRDFQVKVRGQRIELGEIETTLQRHPEVRDAVIALQADRLVGYLVARRPAGLDLADIRAYLRRTLPVVMVPSSLMVLDELPRTPNGKVDRLALPAPDDRAEAGTDPPKGPDEALVAEVWQQLLQVDTVGRDDDFFDLGGDSLLAGQVLSRLRARAGTSVPLRLIFEHSRLADLAAALAATAAGSPPRPAVAVRPADAEPVLSHDQQRLWLDCQLRPGTAYNVHGRRWLRGALDVSALERSIGAIVDRHEALRTTFPVVGGRPVQRVSAPERWRLSVADADQAESAERLADEQARTPLNVADGPLFRCLLVRLSGTEHLLAVTIHHLIADAWSIGLFQRELSALYRVGGDTDRAGLEALPVQYLDYAVWQRQSLTPEWRAAQVAYWRDRLDGAPPALALPTARRRSPGQGVVGGRVHARLSSESGAALHRLCRAHDLTPFMAMAALLAMVLRRWSGQGDLVLGVAVNTRRDAGVDPLIGLFVNTVPLRVDLAGDPPFSELARRVRRAALDDCVNHGETPLDDLTRALAVVRDPLRTPLFQVLLSMVDVADADMRLPGVTVESAQPPPQPGKVDLNLNVHREGDGFGLELLYHAERYDAPMMQAFLNQLAALLPAVAADPTRGILAYELASPPGDPGVLSHSALRHLALARRAAADPDALLEWLRADAVTAVHCAPPLLRAAVASTAAGGPALPGLRYVFLDNRGDLTAHDVELARRLAPAGEVVGVYRAPDTGEPLAGYAVPADWSSANAPLRIPVGVAVAAPAMVRNPAGLPAGIGEVGELWFGDVGTGDLARWRADGLLELAGPAATGQDDPLEVVAALRDLPDVRDAVVTGAAGDTTAFVVGPTVDLDRLRQHLVTRLPEHQVPRRVTVCERLPLTAHGDYDLAALTNAALTNAAGVRAMAIVGGDPEEELL